MSELPDEVRAATLDEHRSSARHVLGAAGVPALLEERDRLRDAVIDVAIEQYQRGGSE